MPHLVAAPILLPLLSAAVILLLGDSRRRIRSLVNLGATIAGLIIAIALLLQVDEQGASAIRVYLTDVEHFDEMNEAYASMLSEPYPSRTTVYVGLRNGYLVEIDALAVVRWV